VSQATLLLAIIVCFLKIFISEAIFVFLFFRNFIYFYRVTSMADRLKIGFALIHREKHHIRESGESEVTGQLETRITLVGDVTNKICFM
jgi:hypothetical protein